MNLYNHCNVINSQLYKSSYNKFTSVYIKFLNSLRVYCINFDLNIIKKKEDLEYLLIELKTSNKKDNEHTFRCKNCTMKNSVSFYNDIEDIGRGPSCSRASCASKPNHSPPGPAEAKNDRPCRSRAWLPPGRGLHRMGAG